MNASQWWYFSFQYHKFNPLTLHNCKWLLYLAHATHHLHFWNAVGVCFMSKMSLSIRVDSLDYCRFQLRRLMRRYYVYPSRQVNWWRYRCYVSTTAQLWIRLQCWCHNYYTCSIIVWSIGYIQNSNACGSLQTITQPCINMITPCF